jgi:hypothetical protein
MCNLPVIRAAVALGLPVHATSNDGMEPIHWACTKGWWQAVQELLQHGADINARNAQQATPVVLAAQYGHTDLVIASPTICCPLSAAQCLLPTVLPPPTLSTAHCLLPSVCCPVSAAHCLLPTACCPGERPIR